MLDHTSEGTMKTGSIHVCDRYHLLSNCKKIMTVTVIMQLHTHGSLIGTNYIFSSVTHNKNKMRENLD